MGGRGRRVVAGALGVVLVGGVAWAAVEVGAGREPAPECAVEAPSVDEAARIAEACGHDVAVTDSYDPWSAVVATPRDTLRHEVSAGAVRTDLTGEWAPVDPTVVRDPVTGELTVASPVYEITLDPVGGEGFLEIAADGSTMSVGVPVDLGDPEVEGSTVSWPILDDSGRLIEGAVLVAQVHPDATGVTPVIEVRDRKAYAALAEAAGEEGVSFRMRASEGLALDPDAVTGEVAAVDESGEVVFRAGEALQWDSAGAREPGVVESGEALGDVRGPGVGSSGGPRASAGRSTEGRGPVSGGGTDPGVEVAWAEVPLVGEVEPALAAGDSVARLDVEVTDEQTVVVRADEAMVADPATVWPISIDPPVSGVTRHEWTVIRSAFGPKFKTTASEGVGLCLRSGGCEADFKSRMIWEFTEIWTLPYLAAGDIVEASFSAYGTHSYDCSGNSLQLHLMSGGISSSTTWSNQPGTRLYLDSQYPTHRSGQCGGPSWVEWDATEGAKRQAGSSSNMVLRVASPSESSMKSWRRYYLYNAKLSIEYNRAPSVPTNQRLTVGSTAQACVEGSGRPFIATNRPKLSAVTKDPDGQNVAAHFQLWQGSSTQWGHTTAAQKSGATHTVTVPDGRVTVGTYKWRVRGQDSDGRYSPWSGWCEFTFDNTKPNAPTVTPVEPTGASSNIQAVYVPDVERGGKGMTGCFRVRSSSGDVVGYQYAFNATTYATSVTPGGDGSVTVCTPSGQPATTGTNFLAVRAVDRAGNLSTGTRYTFEVATAREDGIWTFDSRKSPVADHSTREAGEAARAGDLVVSGARWVPGPHSLFDSRPDDYALDFDGVNDAAVSQSPVFDTRASFVVSAHVRLDTGSGARTAISQEGVWTNAWSVGYRPSGCAITGWSGGCWVFVLHGGDGKATTVYSTVQPKPGEWVHLTAEYDKSERKARLWACEVGTPADPAAGEPVMAQVTAPASMSQAPGPVVLGRGQSGGVAREWWDGQIDNVRLFKGEVVADAKVRRMCQGAEANDFGGNQDALDPTRAGQ